MKPRIEIGARNTVTVEHALEVCSLFASTEPNRGTENVCVRRTQVEGTNGHVLMILPIQEQTWLDGRRLVPADQAMIEGKCGDGEQIVMALPDEAGTFPGTTKLVADLEGIAPAFSCYVNPFYLELIGKAFGMLGIGRVRLVCRGERTAVEIVGQTIGGEVGRAFVMPML